MSQSDENRGGAFSFLHASYRFTEPGRKLNALVDKTLTECAPAGNYRD